MNVASSEAVIAIAFDTVEGHPAPQLVQAYTFCQFAGLWNKTPIHVFDTGFVQSAFLPSKGPVIAFVNDLTVYCEELADGLITYEIPPVPRSCCPVPS